MADHATSFSTCTPRANRIIAALSTAEYQKLEPHLTAVSFDAGAMILNGASSARSLYFPVDCVISLLQADEDGLNEIALVGGEGVAGISLALMGKFDQSRSVVVHPGLAYRLDTAALSRSAYAALQQLLFRYAQILIVQMGQNAYCRRRHNAQQQLCRWLLCCLDRMPGRELRIRPALLAEVLNINEDRLRNTAQDLRAAGLQIIENHLVVINAASGLQQCCCECYTAIEAKTGYLAQR